MLENTCGDKNVSKTYERWIPVMLHGR